MEIVDTSNIDLLDDEEVVEMTLGEFLNEKFGNNSKLKQEYLKIHNIKLLSVNIHMLIAEETFDKCMSVLDDIKTDPRLKDLTAVVFLTLKPKGKRNSLHTLKDISKYRELVEKAFSLGINIGFDSCTAPTFLAAMKDHPLFTKLEDLSESCESDRFSGYANCDGEYWHCSFTEGVEGWNPIDLKKIKDFDSEVWNSPEVCRFRNKLLSQDNSHIARECYMCPIYPLYGDELTK